MNNENKLPLKGVGGSLLPDLLAVLFFVAVSVMYFIVPIRDGLVLSGHDHTGGVGSGVEMDQYRATHNGERTRWTNTNADLSDESQLSQY